jgi:hypothetical protein
MMMDNVVATMMKTRLRVPRRLRPRINDGGDG